MKRFISYLPEEIVTQILLILPFESILTCKLVSKQWRNLISDPKFFKIYNARGSLCLFLYTDDLYCLITRLHNKISGTVEGPEHPPFTVHRVPVDLRLGIWSDCPTIPYLPSGSFNGIACVRRARGDFVLHNLIDRTSFIVDAAVDEFAPPTSRDDNHDYIWWDCFGFGYNRDADDYNIVVAYMTYQLQRSSAYPAYPALGLQRAVQVEGKEEEHQYWVYSGRDAVWKQLKGFPYAPYFWYQQFSRQACAINGVLHWLVRAAETPNETAIVTYDLHTSSYNAKFKMWVMKEYGATDSWVELINLGETIRTNFDKANSSTCQLMRFEPTDVMGIYECRNGGIQVLFVSHNRQRTLCWYDTVSDKIKVIGKHIWSSREGNVLTRCQDFGYTNKFLR